MKVLELTAENFDATLRSTDQPVLVDFWGEWCGPCKMLAPLLDEIAGEWQGRALVVKVDVDNARELAAKLGVRAVPTLIVFKDGQPVKVMQGLQGKHTIEAALAAA